MSSCSKRKKDDNDNGAVLSSSRSLEHKHKKKELQKGDIVNLSDLLFTKDRDFLITYDKRDRPVQAKHLEGKVVVLHFVPLVPWNSLLRREVDSLLDIYNAIHPKACFEVVLIRITPDYTGCFTPQQELHSPLDESFLEKCFEEKFSVMPWTAIPFFDTKSRNSLGMKLGVPVVCEFQTLSVVIDPSGVVLQNFADGFFSWFGAQAYPFSDERINSLRYEDEEELDHPSITKLLTFPECNHVINNKNQEVPVHSLEDKVVALFFYEESLSTDLTIKIQTAYEELLAKEKNFEVVLVYVHDSIDTSEYATEESFWKTFSKMPWLALPYKDSRCKYLKRILSYPVDLEGPGPDPRLVIIGPQGKYYELYGVDILQKFGVNAFPFTRMRIAKSEAKYMKKLKLDMFWDPNTSFPQKNGPEVKLSQLVGKRIILIIDGDWGSAKFWQRLKARYLEMKETDDAFEVIFIPKKLGSSYGKRFVAIMPWFRHPPLPRRSKITKLLCRLFRKADGLVAFDRDGTVGYGILATQAFIDHLRPARCKDITLLLMNKCEKADDGQVLMLYTGLYLVELGVGGIKAAVPSLGADQFDENDPEEARHIPTYFNWYFFSFVTGAMIGCTFLVWVNTYRGWDWGFLVSTLCMLAAVLFLCTGFSFFRHSSPKGSPLDHSNSTGTII